MYRVLIVGYGNIGKRYHQAIKKIDHNIEVFFKEKKTNIKETERLNKLKKNLVDLVIVSTTADVRLSEIKKINKNYKVKSWIIEKNLGQSVNQVNEIQKIFKNKNNIWMSSAYKTMRCYKNLKKELKNKSKLTVNVVGSDWGLVCNGTHFIDLFTWIFNEEVKKIDISNLEKKWIRSKRKNFYEAIGCLKILYNTCQLNLISKRINMKNDVFENITYEIKDKHNMSKYFHEEGIYIKNSKKKFLGNMEFLSDNMSKHIEEILTKNKSSLFRLKDIIKAHRLFISKAFLHWKKFGQKKMKYKNVVPIT